MKRALLPLAIGICAAIAILVIGVAVLSFTTDRNLPEPGQQPPVANGTTDLPDPVSNQQDPNPDQAGPRDLGSHTGPTTAAHAAAPTSDDPQRITDAADGRLADQRRASLLSPRPQPTGSSPTHNPDLVHTINVSGNGAVDATPDMAIVHMAITAQDPSVQAARQRAATLADHAIQTVAKMVDLSY